MPKWKDYMGERYGRWVVVGEAEPTKAYANGRRDRRLLCQCECGTEKVVTRNLLLTGHSKSCGCLATEFQTTHGYTYTKTYRAWWGMMSRHKGHTSPKNYKDRGIKVCKRWHKFENFLKDMGERPETEGAVMTVERVNNNKGYSPSNCVWATMKTQSRNKRTNRNITYKGRVWCITDLAKEAGMSVGALKYRIKTWGSVKRAVETGLTRRSTVFKGETLPLKSLANRYGINYSTLTVRLKLGWSLERALTTPVRRLKPSSSNT